MNTVAARVLPGVLFLFSGSFGPSCSSSDALLHSLDGGPRNQAGSGAPAASVGVGGSVAGAAGGSMPDASAGPIDTANGGGGRSASGGADAASGFAGAGAGMGGGFSIGGMAGDGAVGVRGGAGATGGGGPGLGTVIVLPPFSFIAPADAAPDLDRQSSGFSSIGLGDVNGDGILDVLAGQTVQGDPNPVFMLGKGDGTFDAPITIDSILAASPLLIGDLNGDGRADLAFAYPQATAGIGLTVTFALNNGHATFGSPIASIGTVPKRGFDFTTVSFGDLNGDRRADLAAMQTDGISISLGMGDGTFAPQVTYSYSAGVPAPLPPHNTRPLGRFFAAGDLNGDGSPDFVVSLESGYLSFMLNNGDGTLAAPTFVGTAGLPDVVAIADLDGDGRTEPILGQELIGPAAPMSHLSVYTNGGGVTFGPPVDYPVASSLSLQVVDLNCDGKADLFTDGKDVRVSKGNGVLEPPVTLPISTDGPIAFGDVNGDGKTDVVVGAYRHVHVLLNTCPGAP